MLLDIIGEEKKNEDACTGHGEAKTGNGRWNRGPRQDKDLSGTAEDETRNVSMETHFRRTKSEYFRDGQMDGGEGGLVVRRELHVGAIRDSETIVADSACGRRTISGRV